MGNRFRAVQGLVLHELIVNPQTRGNDEYLYTKIAETVNPLALDMAFSYVLLNRAQLGLPSYDTVCRARRKIQAKHPILKNEVAYDARAEKEKEAYLYAIQ